jgi:hypothetical protein
MTGCEEIISMIDFLSINESDEIVNHTNHINSSNEYF